MPRYIVERTFTEGLNIPVNAQGANDFLKVIGTNAEEGVTWVHTYVSSDHGRTWCVYDAPSPEAIRKVGALNQLPVGPIHEVQVLNPYFYR